MYRTMRTLLAIVIAMGLMMNSGSGIVMAACAKASMGSMGGAHAHPMPSQNTMHSHKEAGDCHKHSSKSPANGCKCCDNDAKCTHDSCSCLKCFSVLANVRPIHATGIILAALAWPGAFDKPPSRVRQPPPPPPQS